MVKPTKIIFWVGLALMIVPSALALNEFFKNHLTIDVSSFIREVCLPNATNQTCNGQCWADTAYEAALFKEASARMVADLVYRAWYVYHLPLQLINVMVKLGFLAVPLYAGVKLVSLSVRRPEPETEVTEEEVVVEEE